VGKHLIQHLKGYSVANFVVNSVRDERGEHKKVEETWKPMESLDRVTRLQGLTNTLYCIFHGITSHKKALLKALLPLRDL
jgi:hypothetical protein